jgi:hypothetical protein
MKTRVTGMKSAGRTGVPPVRTFKEKAPFWTGGTPVLPRFFLEDAWHETNTREFEIGKEIIHSSIAGYSLPDSFRMGVLPKPF